MRKLKMLVVAALMAAAVTALAGVSTASAVTWRPQGTAVSAALAAGTTSDLTDSNGNVVRCSSSTTRLTASGSVATARAASGDPVDYSGCSNSLGLSPTTVRTFGTWTFTANTLTTVTADANPAAGFVVTIRLGGFCEITVTVRVTITGNVWTNGSPSSRMRLNNAISFPLTQSGCLGLVGATGTLAGTYDVTGATIA